MMRSIWNPFSGGSGNGAGVRVANLQHRETVDLSVRFERLGREIAMLTFQEEETVVPERQAEDICRLS